MFLLFVISDEESAVAGEGGEGSASEREPAGGEEEEAGGAETASWETQIAAGGETETEVREEQGQDTVNFFSVKPVYVCRGVMLWG